MRGRKKRGFSLETTGEADAFISSIRRFRESVPRRRTATHLVIQEKMEHHETPNLGPLIIGINSTAVIIAGITCLLRCYVRLILIKAFGLDDYLMVTATVHTTQLIRPK